MTRIFQITCAEHLSNHKDEGDSERVESWRTISLAVAVVDGDAETAIAKYKELPPAQGVAAELVVERRFLEVRQLSEAV